MSNVKNVQEVVKECHLVADTAKDGCPAATYEKMASLLEDVISLSPLMNSDCCYQLYCQRTLERSTAR